MSEPTSTSKTTLTLPDLPIGGLATVHNTPHEADIITTDLPHVRYAVSVTEQSGLEIHEIASEDLRPNPHRAIGERKVTDVESFLSELARRPLGKDDGTLWGNADRGEIQALYNDHINGLAGWRDDLLHLKLKKDADWVRWHEISGKFYRQTEFGDIIEDLLHTVVSPDQADLLEIIDSVRASSRGEFNSEIQRADGGQKVTFNNEVTTKAGRTGQLEVPQTVTLRLVPWEGHDQQYDIDAYFRLKIEGGALLLAVKLKPTRQILRAAWTDVTTQITSEIDKPVYAQP